MKFNSCDHIFGYEKNLALFFRLYYIIIPNKLPIVLQISMNNCFHKIPYSKSIIYTQIPTKS